MSILSRYVRQIIAIGLPAVVFLVAPGTTRVEAASCGNYLARAQGSHSPAMPVSVGPEEESPRSNKVPQPPAPCDGPSCGQAPLAPASTAAAESSQFRTEQTACRDDRSLTLLRSDFNRIFEGPLAVPEGVRPLLERPPCVV